MAETEEKGATPEETAAKWIAQNRATVDGWLKLRPGPRHKKTTGNSSEGDLGLHSRG